MKSVQWSEPAVWWARACMLQGLHRHARLSPQGAQPIQYSVYMPMCALVVLSGSLWWQFSSAQSAQCLILSGLPASQSNCLL